jgi:predicted alpha/beta-fold hydrolase
MHKQCPKRPLVKLFISAYKPVILFMPVIESRYRPPFYFKNGHLATLIPGVFRKIKHVRYVRERISTEDLDFLDLDWSRVGARRLVIISHGLEGNAQRSYMLGMVRFMNEKGWDALAWNCRSCSGEMNQLPRFYHHADTVDLAAVIAHAAAQYDEVLLTGFSMGGSMILKYLGEYPAQVNNKVRGAAVFSVPTDMKSSVDALARPGNRIYRDRFLKKLKGKIEAKARLFPEVISSDGWEEINHFPDFDNRYTAPLHGFEDAGDFYRTASANQYLKGIRLPSLLVNALNDPFLGPECYPYETCRESQYVYLETPEFGGHVGFSLSGQANYMELRTLEFYEQYIQ